METSPSHHPSIPSTDDQTEDCVASHDKLSEETSPVGDVTLNPAWLKPFEHGWRRELVHRSVACDIHVKTPSSDVYYFASDGTKLRSRPQLIDYLKQTNNPLNEDCFTFSKRTIFHEPAESIRHAGRGRGRRGTTHKHKTNVTDDDIETKKQHIESLTSVKTVNFDDKQMSKQSDVLPCDKEESDNDRVGTTENMSSDGAVLLFCHPNTNSTVILSDEIKDVTDKQEPVSQRCITEAAENETLPEHDLLASSSVHDGDSVIHPTVEHITRETQYQVTRAQGRVCHCTSMEETCDVCKVSGDDELEQSKIDTSKSVHMSHSLDVGSSVQHSTVSLTGHDVELKSGYHLDVASYQSEVVPGISAYHQPKSTFGTTNLASPVTMSCTNLSLKSDNVCHSIEPDISPRVVLAELQSRLSTSINSTATSTCWSSDVASLPSEVEISSSGINAQLLTLPRSITNCRNLSRPLTLRFGDRQVIVPPSCIRLTADGAKLLLPPHTLLPMRPAASPIDYSVRTNSLQIDVKRTVDCHSAHSLKVEQYQYARPKLEMNELQKRHADVGFEMSDTSGKSAPQTDSDEATDETLTVDRKDAKTPVSILDVDEKCLLYILSFLNVCDLMKCALVCHRWKIVSLQPTLWKKVTLSGVLISDWKKAADYLVHRQTEHLCLGDGVLCDNQCVTQFISIIDQLITVHHLVFAMCTSSILCSISEKMKHLESICILSFDITDDSDCNISLNTLGELQELTSLKLYSGDKALPVDLSDDCLKAFGRLNNLQELTLLTIPSIPGREFEFLAELLQLQVLAVGNCDLWDEQTFMTLGHLRNLNSLQLCCNKLSTPTSVFPGVLTNMSRLHHLHLKRVSFNDYSKFHELTQLKTCTMNPGSENAELNTLTWKAAENMKFLQHFEWNFEPTCDLRFLPDTFDIESDGFQCVDVEFMTVNLRQALPDTEIDVCPPDLSPS